MPLRRPARALRSLALAALLGPVPVSAHDFWIEPAAYAAPAEGAVPLRLRVGEGFAGDSLPRDPARQLRFGAVGSATELDVPGTPGAEPAGFLVAPEGAWVVVYRSRPGELSLDGAGFARYLAEEGLDRVQRERERRGHADAAVRERFSRCAKSLVRVGEGGDPGGVFTRPVGLPLELVPEKDPTRPDGPRELPFRLLHEGRPVAGALVAAVPSGRPQERVEGRTDAAGRVLLPLDSPGAWLVTSVHMVEAPAGSGADWESLWASLTFEVAE